VRGATGTPRQFWRKIAGPGHVRWSHDLWSTSHETGDYSEWLAPDQYGFVKGAYEGGAHMSTERPYSGRWSWKGQNDPTLPDRFAYSAKVTRWAFKDVAEAYYSAWFWVPATYHIIQSKPVLLMQWKEHTAPNNPALFYNAKHLWTGQDILGVYDWEARVPYDNPAALLPKGRWFNLTVWQKFHPTEGHFIGWLDGAKITDIRNVATQGGAGQPNATMFGVANYANTEPALSQAIYVDDVSVVASTADQLNTVASFSEPGIYVLRLTVSDDIATAHDDMVVRVRRE
jgi:hypothetical protein